MAAQIEKRSPILVILGVENIGKRMLADAVLESTTSSSVPSLSGLHDIEVFLSTDPSIVKTRRTEQMSRLALVVIVIDLTMKNSVDIFQQVHQLIPELALGKVYFIVCGVKCHKLHQIELDSVLKQIAAYNSPVLYGTCKDPVEVRTVAARIRDAVRLNSGFGNRFISPTMLANYLLSTEDVLV